MTSSPHPREGSGFRRLRPLRGRKSKSLLFCRSSDIPGCAMSVPSHLRPDCDGAGRDQPAVALPIRKGELLNDPSPNTIHSQGQWSRRSDPRMQAQSPRLHSRLSSGLFPLPQGVVRQCRAVKRHNMFPEVSERMTIVLTELFQIAFPITVLPKVDRTDSFREERLGLFNWTMSLAICVVVDESKMSGHSDFGIFSNVGASSILTWV